MKYAGVCTVLLGVFFTTSSYAFNSDGHRLIALIAYEAMEEQVAESVIELLEHHPEYERHFNSRMPESVRNGSRVNRHRWLLSQAGVWPDTIRNWDAYHRGDWHYVNFPVFLTSEHEQALGEIKIYTEATKGPDFKKYNIIQAIKNSRRIVEDFTQDKGLRAVHLCWLVHLWRTVTNPCILPRSLHRIPSKGAIRAVIY